jgi:hypothetical protein
MNTYHRLYSLGSQELPDPIIAAAITEGMEKSRKRIARKNALRRSKELNQNDAERRYSERKKAETKKLFMDTAYRLSDGEVYSRTMIRAIIGYSADTFIRQAEVSDLVTVYRYDSGRWFRFDISISSNQELSRPVLTPSGSSHHLDWR